MDERKAELVKLRYFVGLNFEEAAAALGIAVSPDSGLVASSNLRGQVRFFDPAKGELIETLHGHLNAVFDIAFSPDGRQLISSSGGREAIKLWDVVTRQELLTLAGTGSFLGARWSADGDVILTDAPWQARRAPSWSEINAAEAKEKVEAMQKWARTILDFGGRAQRRHRFRLPGNTLKFSDLLKGRVGRVVRCGKERECG